ncbi:AsmA-like C-terminal region-containing protein [Salinicola sp. RZ23]|uniref:YhdP family phospholipid transporter n=1 Tax=Salinicola sp. RZ23 TaxID=1949087 RepID=UPI000DA18809|nr:AsmA-like C-terminal region-containing protein [Salinicola sp. RZ23]
MSPLRITLRWLLTLVAVLALVLALVVSGVRLLAWQSERLAPPLMAWLDASLETQGNLGGLSLSLSRFDPSLSLDDLDLKSQGGQPLLEVAHAHARLDSGASWDQRAPVFTPATLEGLTLHLYRSAKGGWGWPDGAGSRWFGARDDDAASAPPDLDRWLVWLTHQQAVLENVTLVLHANGETRPLTLSRLDLASRDGQASLVARLAGAAGQAADEASPADAESAGRLQLSVDSGVAGASGAGTGPVARFDGRFDLGVLTPLLALLTQPYPRSLAALDGELSASGEWRDGGLRQARLALDVPTLQVVDSGDGKTHTLNDIGVEGGLTRDADGQWQAWADDLRLAQKSGTQVSGTQVSATRVPGTQGAGAAADIAPLPSWPQRLQARSTPQGWWLRSTPFALGGMVASLRQLPLPEALLKPLRKLDPQGRVAGLEVGRDAGEWYAQAALEGVSVSAWDDAPGGGPFDAWATFRGRGGRVAFAGGPQTRFLLPSVYAEPLVLSAASGIIDWHLTHDGAVLSGEHLRAGWRGASASGRFGLTLYDAKDKPGAFMLDLAFADADARRTRLLPWLPTRALDDPELMQWLGGDIGGVVKHGRLGLSLTLSDKEAPEAQMFSNPDDRFTLALDIADGRLQYAPDWPALEQVYGHLQMHNMNLQAQIDHASSHGLTTRDAVVTLADQQLAISGDVSGSSAGLLGFLSQAPLDDLSRTFGLWRSQGKVDAALHIALPMTPQSDAETDLSVDVQGHANVESLTFPELQLTLGGINGPLHYRHQKGQDYLQGQLGARAFDGPLLATFDIGGAQGQGITFEGRALARGLLGWAGLSRVGGLASGFFPYRAQVSFDDQNNASLAVRSDLEGLAIQLPAPFGKAAGHREPLAIDADIAAGSGSVTLADWGRARWRTLGEQVQGQVWLEGWPGAQAAWPSEPGWYVLWRPNRLDTRRWASALTALQAAPGDAQPSREVPTAITDDLDKPESVPVNDGGGLKRVALATPCILVEGRCLGGMQADASPLSGGGWQLSLDGEIAAGRARWQPQAEVPIDVSLARLNLDALTPKPAAGDKGGSMGQTLMTQIETAPRPIALPDGLARVPAGQVKVAHFERQGKQFGPLEARWRADDRGLTLDPLKLTLGDIGFSGNLRWEASGSASLTRANLQAKGKNLGSAFAALDQQVPITSERAQGRLQLAWPGAPWQFALPLASGRLAVDLGNGRLRQVHSSSAKLVGLFNLDNILRRLKLDFSDVTSSGTAFNTLKGSATLYNGVIQSDGPLVVDGTSTRFTLSGSVDLNRQTLDQRLGITVPVSQNLPLVAIMAGAPQVGLGLFVFHQLFGRWIDNVTQVHYRIQGPWSAPDISVESAQ